MPWIVIIALLLVDLYYSYFWVANHHFMLLFMVLSLMLLTFHKQESIFIKNIQFLVVVVIMASVIQKLSSSQFINGSFYYHALDVGALFKKIFIFFPDSLDIVQNNSDNINVLYKSDPNLREYIVLKPVFNNLKLISVLFAWLTIIIEFIVAAALLWKPKSTVTHLLFIAMIIAVLVTRLETGFMALLSLSGLFLCANKYLRFIYILIILGCIILIITKIGYH
ncbi:hypothetical protein [Winogradskyella endarachnes]|uniref:Uncharacterized protein n=1 Tax=Winogradskyella endarachnes TaxID=2681965 RepID=A0A6L6U5N4_9FLAO|nr:hypothetical protein [Winogradskyella endarachnes]MUU77408.1 hypothetical protein [Winogradskyella endarachnes]